MSKGDRVPREQVAEVLRQIKEVVPSGGRVEAAGSFRRGRLDCGDLDLVVEGEDVWWQSTVMNAIANLAGEANCSRTKDNTLKSVTLSGLKVELYLARPGTWGSLWLFTVGSGEWNIYQRAVANRKNLMLSQWGLFHSEIDHKGKRVAGRLIAAAEEQDIFEALGMKYIEPEEREPGKFGR